MNEKRIEDLRDSYMAFESTEVLESISLSNAYEPEAIEAARRELEQRKSDKPSGTDANPELGKWLSITSKISLIIWILLIVISVPVLGLGLMMDTLVRDAGGEMLPQKFLSRLIVFFFSMFAVNISTLVGSKYAGKRNKKKLAIVLSSISIAVFLIFPIIALVFVNI